MIYPPCPVPKVLNLTAIHTFSHRTFKKNYFFGGESHDFAEAVCVLKGEVGITADKHVYTLSEGQMALHPPGEFHAIWSHGECEPETFVFSFSLEPNLAYSRTVYELSSEELLIGLNPHNKSTNYTRILSVMEKNLHTPLTLEDLSRLCDMSIPSLEKTVFRYSHCGVIYLYNSIRMKKAREYLKEGMSVKEVAVVLGFSNQNYFSTAFKKHFGKPPSFYRLSK